MNHSFVYRYRHQLLIDLKRSLVPVAVFLLVLVCRLMLRVPQPSDDGDHTADWVLRGLHQHLVTIGGIIATVMLYRIIRADAPSNADTASLTRPVGTGALWLSKLTVMLMITVLPWSICDWIASLDTLHGGWSQLAVVMGGALGTLFVAAPAAAIFSLASSTRQIAIMFFIGLLGFVIWAAMNSPMHVFAAQLSHPSLSTRHECAVIVAALILVEFALAAWWLSAVPRQRRRSILVLILAFAQWPLTIRVWSVNWLLRPELAYTRNVTLKTGAPKTDDKAPGRPFWKGLRIAGLGKDEVASIVAFAPFESFTAWPGEKFFTDLGANVQRGEDETRLLRTEHARLLMSHFASTDLWLYPYSPRPRLDLRKVIHDSTRPWRLRVAVHELRRMCELPLDDVWTRTHFVAVDEGHALQLGPNEIDQGHDHLNARLVETRSKLIAPSAHARMRYPSGKEAPMNLVFILRDNDAREIAFNFSQPVPSATANIPSSIGWLLDENTVLDGNYLTQPRGRFAMGLTTKEEWRKNSTLQVWVLDFKGTRDFDLSPDQLKQALDTK